MNYYSLVDRYDESIDLQGLKKLYIGSGKKYFVERENMPYLLVEVDVSNHYFDTACIFNQYLCVGVVDTVIFIDLDSLNYKSEKLDMYFGYFYVYKDMLFIASGVGITAYNKELKVIWKNSDLAVDGVIIYGESKDGKYLEISCEMNPPGDWQKKIIDISTGNEIYN